MVRIKWETITNELKVCKAEKDGVTHKFTLTLQDIGVYGSGKSLVLRGKIVGEEVKVICSLWIIDDGHQGYERKSHKGKLWDTIGAIVESESVIKNLVENVY